MTSPQPQPQQAGPQPQFVTGRSKTACLYSNDTNSAAYGFRVAAQFIGQASLGWTPGTAGASYQTAPRGLRYRRVRGQDASGFRGSAIVPSVTAPIWTGAASTFDVLGQDGTSHTCTVTMRVGERIATIAVPA